MLGDPIATTTHLWVNLTEYVGDLLFEARQSGIAFEQAAQHQASGLFGEVPLYVIVPPAVHQQESEGIKLWPMPSEFDATQREVPPITAPASLQMFRA
jgi:hypothetical protein